MLVHFWMWKTQVRLVLLKDTDAIDYPICVYDDTNDRHQQPGRDQPKVEDIGARSSLGRDLAKLSPGTRSSGVFDLVDR
ncbi:hypothetical protein J6590_092875 [Homalodisca vitripennis]|nr:hypothetical protein J6590_092875 [Homalodisca vitripennis]